MNTTTTRTEMDEFAGFDATPMQPLGYPVGLSPPTTTSSSASEIAQLRTALGHQLHENERLRIELAQHKRKLFQKQQQIYRLMDHVKRLARVLSKYIAGTVGHALTTNE